MNEFKNGTQQTGVTTAEMFTYVLIVIVVSAVALGHYVNASLKNAVSEAVTLGETRKAFVEEYFDTHGEMPHSDADAGLDEFTPEGVLVGMTWQRGILGDSDADTTLTGTLNAQVTLSEFGERFEEYESGYLLIAKAQDDGTIVWICIPNTVSPGALPGRYLPEGCENSNNDDE